MKTFNIIFFAALFGGGCVASMLDIVLKNYSDAGYTLIASAACLFIAICEAGKE